MIPNKISLILLVLIVVISSCSQNNRIEETALSIKEINEIGELITAEYHGEVIHSLRSIYQTEDSSRYANAYHRFKESYEVIAARYKSDWRRANKFRKKGLTKTAEYKFLVKASRTRNLENFLEELKDHSWDSFYKKHKDRFIKRIIKDHDKTELVFLARGWVKAGFDLQKMGSNVFIIPSNDTLFIRNLDPVILNADINPWYIRDEIPGFEIILTNKEAEITYNDVEMLKHETKLRLLQQAYERDIYRFAIESGQEALLGLFSATDQGNACNTVLIKPSKYFWNKVSILEDHKIDEMEFQDLRNMLDEENTWSVDKAWFPDQIVKNDLISDFLDDLYLHTIASNNAIGWDQYFFDKTAVYADFDCIAPDSVFVGDTIRFINLSSGFPERVQWEIGQKKNSKATDYHLSTSFVKPGNYTIHLTIQKDELVSSVTDSIRIYPRSAS